METSIIIFIAIIWVAIYVTLRRLAKVTTFLEYLNILIYRYAINNVMRNDVNHYEWTEMRYYDKDKSPIRLTFSLKPLKLSSFYNDYEISLLLNGEEEDMSKARVIDEETYRISAEFLKKELNK